MNLIKCNMPVYAGTIQRVKNDGDRYTAEMVAAYQAGAPVDINLDNVQMIRSKPHIQLDGQIRDCAEFQFGKEQSFTVWETLEEVRLLVSDSMRPVPGL